MKDKNAITITNAFQNTLDESNRHVRSDTLAMRANSEGRKQNKIWVDKGSKLFNRSVKSGLQGNDTEMYSAHNEGKSVAAGRFIRILKNKINKYMTSVSKNVYIDKLDDLVNKYNDKYYDTMKMKSVDVQSSRYIDFNAGKMIKILNLTLVIMKEYQNIKAFLQMTTL